MLIYNRLSKEITTCRFLLQTTYTNEIKQEKKRETIPQPKIFISIKSACKVDLEFLNQPVVS